MTAYLNQFKFTVEEYYKLAEVGIIKDTDKVELLNGQIITMSPINSFHSGIVNRIIRLLGEVNGREASISAQNPIQISDDSEPEPDIVIAKFREDDYIYQHPTSDDVLCLIEVSDSTLSKDRQVKKDLYAAANIPEYWIVNLVDKQIEVCRQPKNGVYHLEQIITKGGTIELDRLAFSVSYDQIFPEI